MPFISLTNVSLRYPIYGGYANSLRSRLMAGLHKSRFSSERGVMFVDGLKNVSIDVEAGDRIGLIGRNGAGKTTLLKVLAGIYAPSEGVVEVEGRVTSLLNTSLGMEADATGYENIFLVGTLLGMSASEIRARTAEIEEFTELGDFLNMPVRTYSAGMSMRLSFAIFTSVKPEILLVDEAIGAGDAKFYKKARERIHGLLHGASLLFLASHSNDVIRKFCNKAMLLERGEVVAFGDVDSVIGDYESMPMRDG